MGKKWHLAKRFALQVVNENGCSLGTGTSCRGQDRGLRLENVIEVHFADAAQWSSSNSWYKGYRKFSVLNHLGKIQSC